MQLVYRIRSMKHHRALLLLGQIQWPWRAHEHMDWWSSHAAMAMAAAGSKVIGGQSKRRWRLARGSGHGWRQWLKGRERSHV
jgi:hypothetical protein